MSQASIVQSLQPFIGSVIKIKGELCWIIASNTPQWGWDGIDERIALLLGVEEFRPFVTTNADAISHTIAFNGQSLEDQCFLLVILDGVLRKILVSESLIYFLDVNGNSFERFTPS